MKTALGGGTARMLLTLSVAVALTTTITLFGAWRSSQGGSEPTSQSPGATGTPTTTATTAPASPEPPKPDASAQLRSLTSECLKFVDDAKQRSETAPTATLVAPGASLPVAVRQVDVFPGWRTRPPSLCAQTITFCVPSAAVLPGSSGGSVNSAVSGTPNFDAGTNVLTIAGQPSIKVLINWVMLCPVGPPGSVETTTSAPKASLPNKTASSTISLNPTVTGPSTKMTVVGRDASSSTTQSKAGRNR